MEYKFIEQLTFKQRILYFINNYFTFEGIKEKKLKLQFYLKIKYLDICHLKRKLFNFKLNKELD